MLKDIVQYILSLGAGVFMPALMLVLGFVVRMKFKRNVSAALTLGVAFIGMSVVMNFMTGAISPAAQELVKNTGLKLNALDVGWTPLSAISWAWPYAFLMFPVQIGINIFMLAVGWTSCLNVDMWNIWNKILTAVLVLYVSHNLIIAFLVAGIQVVLELKNADLLQKQIYSITKIPGITLSHCHALLAVTAAPVNSLLDYIPGLKNWDIDAEKMKEKIGIFGENHITGFILGVFIALLARYNFKDTATLGIQAATALTLLPMVAKLFMTALAPFSDAASAYVKKRFPGRNFYIGLDWPFLAGESELWVVLVLIIPVVLLMSLIVPGNSVLPFGGILMTGLAFTTLVITNKNMVRMIILSIIYIPVFLYTGTYFAPAITDLARNVGTINIPAGQMITRMGIEAPIFRVVFMEVSKITVGSFMGLVYLVIYAAFWVWYYRIMKKKNIELSKMELSEKEV